MKIRHDKKKPAEFIFIRCWNNYRNKNQPNSVQSKTWILKIISSDQIDSALYIAMPIIPHLEKDKAQAT